MANGKETKREKKDAARKARIEAQRRAAARAKKRKLFTVLVLIVIAGLIGFAVWNSGRAKRDAATRLNAVAVQAGCSNVEEHAEEGREHVEEPATVDYGTEPPTSGNHYGNTSLTGVHTTPVKAESLVHNLEHGHVIAWYDPAKFTGEVLDALEAVVRGHETEMLAVPRAELAAENLPLAFSSWGRSMTCATPGTADEVTNVAEAYFDAYVGTGAEGRIPGTPNR